MKLGIVVTCAAAMIAAGCSTPDVDVPSTCSAATPPPDAGELVEDGAKLLVSPRANRMSADYSGCQTVWIDIGHGPRLIGRFRYEQGRYVAYSAPLAGKPEATLCRYRNGKLIAGAAQDCESDEATPIATMAPGCHAVVLHSQLVNQPVPARCNALE